MAKRQQSIRTVLGPSGSTHGWTKTRDKDRDGRPQIVYQLGSNQVINRVTLPLVRGFSE
ncbi:hypothetical protein [Cohaesibacter marisflavi]|uniref:hypothetical protein n=1 Tax=Cohaesibacter marisflavi TaxID=655353 RepID=UPI0029C90B3A|nr:hypothetical protein [Cohaesibacter marisflavi]